jgi:hypothetical protein
MTKRKITKRQVLDTMTQVVTEYGADHTAVCSYLDLKRQPVCIVGHVVTRLAPDVDLMQWNATSLAGAVYRQNTTYDSWLLQEVNKHFTPAAIKALARAQDVQDGSGYLVTGYPCRTWGEALDAAAARV